MTFDEHRPLLITGGAGFIGTNVADRLMTAGQPVVIYDSLARAGGRENLRWLQHKHGKRLEVIVADLRDLAMLRPVVERCCRVFHLAGQVAVTTSLAEPARDFAVNAGGTLGLLETIRGVAQPPPLVYTSTSKVYGPLAKLDLVEREERYCPPPEAPHSRGISEDQPLDFHSPHGCSKGAADQYVLDYARVYGLKTVVFRLSCTYGPHQRGTEDQGWLAHLAWRALGDEPITIFGDGKQVRDVLYVDDLVEALLIAQARIGSLAGTAFNIGGGPRNTLTPLELLGMIERMGTGSSPDVRFGPWRPADQRYYVSNIEAFTRATGWRPRVGVQEGVARLLAALRARAGRAYAPVPAEVREGASEGAKDRGEVASGP
jgi:CDP-paratose 2-epimerase